VDWLGFNYYHPARVQAPEHDVDTWGNPVFAEEYVWPDAVMNKSRGWEIYPQGIYDFAMTMTRDYPELDWFVSENGIGIMEADRATRTADGTIDDSSYRIPFGVSICYTSRNYKDVTSDEFLDMLVEKGCIFAWYFHYMPVGMNASTDLLLTPEQRLYMKDRIRWIRGLEGGKPLFAIDFQNDGEFVSGCVAGGKYYCHINAAGDVEPCVFIHYSSANVNEMSFLDCLRQPLFQAYHDSQPFNDNHLRPCPMLENPEILQRLVKETGAHSTDLEAPESAEHLCGKCELYAQHWTPVAEEVWEETHATEEVK
jgi:hypothetical protein